MALRPRRILPSTVKGDGYVEVDVEGRWKGVRLASVTQFDNDKREFAHLANSAYFQGAFSARF